jgi:hypothetical protein
VAILLLLFLVRDATVVVASLVPIVTAVTLFSAWQGRLDQVYWFLVVAPSAAIALFAWIPRVHPRAWVGSLAALLILLAAQPARAHMAWTFHRMPGYGAMVDGCRAIVHEGRPVRDVRVAFRTASNPDAVWLCSILGVAITSDPAPIAIIDRMGRVHYE